MYQLKTVKFEFPFTWLCRFKRIFNQFYFSSGREGILLLLCVTPLRGAVINFPVRRFTKMYRYSKWNSIICFEINYLKVKCISISLRRPRPCTVQVSFVLPPAFLDCITVICSTQSSKNLLQNFTVPSSRSFAFPYCILLWQPPFPFTGFASRATS